MCTRCESCDKLLSAREMFKTVVLEDGTKKEIIDNFCFACIGTFVQNADMLETRSYQHQHISDRFWDDNGASLGNSDD